MEKSTEYPSKLKGKDYVDRVFTREAVEQILNARVKPVNEDRIKEIIKDKIEADYNYCADSDIPNVFVNEKSVKKCAHALAVEFSVPVNEKLQHRVDRVCEYLRESHCDDVFYIIHLLEGNKPEEYESTITKPVPICDHEPLEELTALKQRIDEIDEQWVYNFIAENSAKYFHYDTLKETFSDKFTKSMAEIDGELSKKIAVAIHDKIKGEEKQ
jgi:hypothetical protein